MVLLHCDAGVPSRYRTRDARATRIGLCGRTVRPGHVAPCPIPVGATIPVVCTYPAPHPMTWCQCGQLYPQARTFVRLAFQDTPTAFPISRRNARASEAPHDRGPTAGSQAHPCDRTARSTPPAAPRHVPMPAPRSRLQAGPAFGRGPNYARSPVRTLPQAIPRIPVLARATVYRTGTTRNGDAQSNGRRRIQEKASDSMLPAIPDNRPPYAAFAAC